MAATRRYTKAPPPKKKPAAPKKASAGAKAGANGAKPTAKGAKAGAKAAPAKAAVNQPPAPKPPSGGLRNAVAIPVAVSAAAASVALGLVAAAAEQLGLPVVPLVIGAGIVLSVALALYAGWIVNSAAVRPLAQVRAALQEMEGGNYDARLATDADGELGDLQEGFNRMATIVSHQRERLKLAAATDALTGLANQTHFLEQLRMALQDAREIGQPLAVTRLDIDCFKKLNDDLGHGRADETLRAAGDALRKAVRQGDLVGRLGGDDFVLLMPCADPGYARDASERARAAMARILPEDLNMTVSAGFVCFPEQSEDGASLAELANSALDVAKRNGGDQTRKYDPDQVSAIPSIKQQRAEIDELLAHDSPIRPVFQPLVELATGRLVGYEALSRFNTDVPRSPDAWFNQAQRCGRGLALEMAAIKAALSAPGRPRGVYLSLNFSPSALASPKILSVLPSNMTGIVVEVTEHELASEDGGLEEGLARLRARGARIAVDDAGAGYAGLNQVMRVQPDMIKLDRSLIEGVHADSAKAALVEFFVMFARRVGAGVCTEGIETLDELRTLINLGVSYGQGYLLGRPADPWPGVSDEITRTLATGALRTHVAPSSRGGSSSPYQVPAAMRTSYGAVVPGGAVAPPPPQEAPVPGPINRRLNRY